MITKRTVWSCLLIALILLSGCQTAPKPEPVAASPTPQATQTQPPSPTPTVTPTATPTLMPSPTPLVFAPAAADWNSAQIKSVCVSQEWLPGMEPGFSNEGTNLDRLLKILTELGLDPVSGSGSCDATLKIVLMGTPSTSKYQRVEGGPIFDCDTGIHYYGLMLFTKPGLTPMAADLINEGNNAPTISKGCPDQAETIDTTYSQLILEGLSKMLGPRVITAMFHSPDRIQRRAAYMASETFGPDNMDLLPEMVAALKVSTDLSDWNSLASGFEKMGPQAQKETSFFVQDIIKRQKAMGKGLGIGIEYVSIYRKLGEGAKDAIPLLLEMYNQYPEGFPAPNELIQALGDIGPSAKDAVPLLIKLALKDGIFAEEALGKIGPVTPDVMPTIWEINRNKTKYPFAWIYSFGVLERLYAADPEVVPYLISLCEGQDAEAATLALEALDSTDMPQDVILTLLSKALANPNQDIRSSAIQRINILGDKLGPGVKEFVPALLQSAKKKSDSSAENYQAIGALVVIASDNPEVIALLKEIIQQDPSLADMILPNLRPLHAPNYRPLMPQMIDRLRYLQRAGRPTYGLVPHIRGLVYVAGTYPGYMADDWQKWLEAQ